MSINALIQQEKYNEAIAELENKLDTQENYQTLSLLYRLEDQYEKESALVEKAAEIYPDSAYLSERHDYHQRPIYDRLVPRRKIDFPRDPAYIPSQEMLENTCIVTAGSPNARYIDYLKDLLTSLKATKFYKDIPIGVLEFGELSDDLKQELISKFGNLEFKKAKWHLEPYFEFGEPCNGISCNHEIPMFTLEKTFINHYFSQYKYLLFIDADIWIQDETGLDHFLYDAKNRGIGCSYGAESHSFGMAVHQGYLKIYQEDVEKFGHRWGVNSGLYCIDTTTDIYSKWQELTQLGWEEMIQIVKNRDNICRFGDQPFLNTILYRKFENPKILGMKYNFLLYQLHMEQNAFVIYDDGVLHTKYKEPIVAVHAAGVKHALFIPMRDLDGNETIQSIRYRVWPWQDKPEIKAQLLSNNL